MSSNEKNTGNLLKLVIDNIDEYLSGKLSEEEASKWALKMVKKHPIRDNDIAFALMDLMCLDEPERFRTAKEDLIRRRDRLMSKTPKMGTFEL